ncbi:DUF2512 family protein [Heyndrickxia acidicola]|uniref:DUF2512 family protein n=1 Tax=Heyndrickxia acidicola TaxID=209389 RepID=A0ABU6MJ28_9BACI|nr:DUF2512 family protein [Heyndrickxia acidicola]MED1204676.1 DUF2512 family protein [Heyndrickxia acidicola]
MNQMKAIAMKFVMIAVVLGVILSGIFQADFGQTLLISLVLTVLAYLFGDLAIFRHSGSHLNYRKRNVMATISDAVLAFLVIWLMGAALLGNGHHIVIASIISTIVIGAGEWFFHYYLENHVFGEKHRHSNKLSHP